MRHLAIVALVVLSACEEWPARMKRIQAIRDKAHALAEIETVDAELAKRDTARALVMRAQLLVSCKLPRLDMMAKGGATLQAIGHLEKALEKEPVLIGARYLLARCCLGLPGFFGRGDRGIEVLAELVAMAERRPGTVPYPDVFLRLAKLKPQERDRILRIGRRSFPDHPGMRPGPVVDGTGAKRAFVAALEAGRIEDYARLDAALAAAQLEHGKDADLPLLRGLLRLWRLERTQDGHAASEGIELFERAMALNPNDTRIHGWLGPLLYLSGKAIGRQDMVARGRKMMDEGAGLNPEQNLFGRALAYRRAGEQPEQVEEDLYRTVEICSQEKMDRARFIPAGGRRDHPACRDSKKAPYNLAGTLYWAGEFFRARGKARKAQDAFEAALRLDAKGTWPYRALARERLDALAGRRKELTKNPASCLLCHQTEKKG